MDRPRGDRFSDRPAGGGRFSDRPDDGSGFSDRPGGDGGGGRHGRMPSRWSSGSPTGPHPRYPRGGGEGFSGGGGRGGRHHPYREPPQDFPGGGPGFRDGPGGGGGFEPPMPMGGQKRGFHGRGGGSPEYPEWGKFVKLFIGSVPRTATEEDIRPLFEEHGDVIEVALIKDKRTGQQQGCCFIKYGTSEEADRAIRALHNQYTLPGGSGPIQVRYADGERESLGTVEHKLFVASLNKQASEKEIEEIFSPYGHVEDVYLMRDEVKQSRGCGFVKFSTREMAAAALNVLHGTFVMRGCEQPLIVRFANPKRPRPGESRGGVGPAFGGPGFGPRSESSPGMRPLSHFDEQMGGSVLPNAWHQRSPQALGPASQGNNLGFGPQSAAKDTSASSAPSGIPGAIGGPSNGSHLGHLATQTSSQQNFNPSVGQVHLAVGQQTSSLQKPLMPSQDLPNSFQLHHSQHILTTQSQAQPLQAPMQQLGQSQAPQSINLPPFGQNVPSQQFSGVVGQLSSSQPLIQQNATASALQTPLGIQHQGMPAVANQQQLSSSNISQQLLQQPIQQLPSQIPQVLLQQQAQALQSSFQSSQQAIFQLQQQLHQMQQSSQQQGSQAVKQQPLWNEQQPISGASAGSTAAVVPSTTSATSVHPVTASVPLTCNWSEHTSPEGYKYYYNSATHESKWEKPEELTIFEQQQQQQKLILLQPQNQKIAVQQLQSPSQSQSQGQVQPSQQISQTLQLQAQMQLRQQAQVQILQSSLGYQGSAVAGNQNTQVDSEERPAMCYIYELMDRAKEKIQQNCGENIRKYGPIWNKIDARWTPQLHQSLHAAGYYLNPSLRYDDTFSNVEEVKQGLGECMERMLPYEDRLRADLQLDAYDHCRLNFGSQVAIDTRKLRSPADWWLRFGGKTPELQSFAIRVLSLTCSASGCERNWSTFEADSYYAQIQTANPVIDPSRIQQGIQAAQEWAWKNKPAGS